MRWADRYFGHLRPDFLLDYTLHNPRQAFYLKLLAGLSQVFQKAENRDKLLEADTSEKLWKALMKATRLVIQ